MKISELLTEARSRQVKLDNQEFRKDYQRFKKYMNMPIPLVRQMAGEDKSTRGLATNKKGGTVRNELRRKYGFTIPRTTAKALLRLRLTPVKEWSTVEINWMYRILKYLDSKTSQRIPLENSDGTPSEQLKDLWAWGHIPRNLRPTSKKFKKKSK